MPRVRRPGAVALRYRTEAPFLDMAPRLVAKGQGHLAERILALAQANDIPIRKDPDLLAALEPLEVDRVIPPELFKAVAILMAALYRANAEGEGLGKPR